MKIRSAIRFFICLLCFSLLSFSLLIPANAENEVTEEVSDVVKTFTVSYGKGIYISYQGSEPKNFIKGTPPASQTVEQNGTVTVAANTFTFRDYSFGGWKYTYTDSNGDKKSKYYSAGDIIENVSSDMKLEATWTKKEVDLKVGAYLTYADSNVRTEHYIGEIIVLKKAPSSPAENYKFCGWTDNEGNVLYSNGDNYEIKNINTIIKPVWSVNGEKINYKKISVTTKGNGSASISQIFLLSGTSQQISFSPEEGYFLSSLKVNGADTNTNSTLTVTAKDEDIYIEAVFKKIESSIPDNSSEDDISAENGEYSIKINIEGKGNVSPSGNATVRKGDSFTLTFTPDKNYTLPVKITDNGKDIVFGENWDGQYIIENANENHDIKIQFINLNDEESSSEEESKSNNQQNNTSNFTGIVCISVFVIAVIFGFIAVNHNNRKNKKKKKCK